MRSKLHKFLKDRFGTLCTAILLLVISQGAWAGTLPNSGESYTFHSEKVTGYGTTSDVAFTRLDNNHFVCQFTLEGGSGNSHKYQFSLKCSNGNYYRKNNQHFSGADTEVTDITATSGNFMDIQCTTATTYYVFVELWCSYSSDSKLIVRLSTASNFYLGGYLNAGEVNSHNNTWKLTQNGSNYEGVFTFSTNHDGAQWLWVLDASDNKWGTFSDVTTTVGGTSTIYQKVTSGKVKAPTTTGKEYKVTFTPSTGALKWERNITTVPTVNIAANESVAGDGVSITLNGYVKYNGCKTITDYGFVYGAGSTPTTSDNKIQVGTNNISRGTSYSKTFEENSEGTYYYRAYIIAGGTTYYSSEVRTFTVAPVCDVSANNFDIYVNSESESSATYDKSEEESESATLSTEKYGTTYTWSCTDYATGATSADVHITNSNKRNASVVCDKTGVYLFQLTVTCNDNTYTSKKCTLNVCAPADEQTVYIDGYTASKACPGDQSTVTCKSESDYYYTLFLGYQSFGTLEGSGATLTWRGVTGEGTFEVKSSPKSMPQCEVTIGTATQSYVEGSIEIDADPGLTVTPYKAITLSKGDDSNIDGDLIWNITEGPSGYLIDPKYSREYEYRSRSSVVFKGGLTAGGASASYTVTATGSKSEIITGTTKKTCQITESVDITVNPATESCP